MLKGIRVLCLILAAVGAGLANDLDTVLLRAVLDPANEVPPVTGVQAAGECLVRVHVNRGASGIVNGIVDFDVAFNYVGAIEFTGLHIHEAPAGVNAGIVIPTDVSNANRVAHPGGNGTISRQVVVNDGALLTRLLTQPSGFYCNLHTTQNGGGVMRGQMTQPDVLVLRTTLSPLNETPPIADLNASGSANIIAYADRNASGVISGGGVIFDVNYRFPSSVDLTGLHIHNGAAGVAAGVVIGTDVGGANTIRGVTSGNVLKVAPIRTQLQLDHLRGLFVNPAGYYANLHTNNNPGGAIRGQLLNTGQVVLRTTLTTADEAPSPAGLEAQGLAKITAHVTRNLSGQVTGGTFVFDVNHQFPADTEFTGLHIHRGDPGVAGGVVISSGLSNVASVRSAGGVGNVYRVINVDADSPAALAALNDLIANPSRYYLNLHTTQFPGGAIRGQMGAALASPQINPSGIISAVNIATIAAASPGSIISIYGSNLAATTADASGSDFPALPFALNGAEVRIGGRQAPMYFVSPNQINAQVPFETEAGNVQVIAVRGGEFSSPLTLAVGRFSPGIFVTSAGAAVLKNRDFSPVSSTNPAAADDVLLIFSTGLGAVTPAVASGQFTPLGPVSLTTTQPTVTVGGRAAEVLGSALTPGFVGLYQVAIRMPSGVASGNQPVVITIGGVQSNAAQMAVR